MPENLVSRDGFGSLSRPVLLLVVQVLGLEKKYSRLDCSCSSTLHNMLLILEYYIELLPVLLLLYFVPHIIKTINSSRDTMMSDRCNHLVYLLRQVGWQLALRYSANEKMSACLSVCLLLRVLCTSDLQLRLSFMIFPTDIALDFIIYSV